MKELTVFENSAFGSVRTVELDGEPWFVGKDVATALGYSNTKDALANHDPLARGLQGHPASRSKEPCQHPNPCKT